MELFVAGKVKEQTSEDAEWEGRKYQRQQMLLFVPDGEGMGESIVVSVQQGKMPELPMKAEVRIRIRAYEERRGVVTIKCRPGDIRINGKARG